MMYKRGLALIVINVLVLSTPAISEGKYLFHATSRKAADKILKKGFSVNKMNPQARFGKGVYLSESKRIALKEKPLSHAVLTFKDTKLLKKNIIDTKRLSPSELKSFSKDKDLRGNIRKGIIKGDLAKKMGMRAGEHGKALRYHSAKGDGMNIFIPKRFFQQHPQIVKPIKIEPVGN